MPTATKPLIGSHVEPADPLDGAVARNADVVQFFLADPQGWKAPQPRADSEKLAAQTDTMLFVHAPYVVNVASPDNRIRIPSRKLVAQHAAAAASVGAKGLIVHGGHVTANSTEADGIENWRKLFERTQDSGGFPVPILIENTAGGDHSMARRFDVFERLWDAIGEYQPGFCLDTCHAHAGGEDLVGIVDRVLAITGRIDLVHLNDSKDGFDSGRDRHQNLGTGKIELDLLVEVVRNAGAPIVCETPGGIDGQAGDIALLRERV